MCASLWCTANLLVSGAQREPPSTWLSPGDSYQYHIGMEAILVAYRLMLNGLADECPSPRGKHQQGRRPVTFLSRSESTGNN